MEEGGQASLNGLQCRVSCWFMAWRWRSYQSPATTDHEVDYRQPEIMHMKLSS